jgi:hypothetical protein
VTASGILLTGPETLLTAPAGTFPDCSHQLSSLLPMSPRVSQQSDTSRTIHSAEQPTRIRCQGLSTAAYHSRAGQIWRVRPVTRTRRIGGGAAVEASRTAAVGGWTARAFLPRDYGHSGCGELRPPVGQLALGCLQFAAAMPAESPPPSTCRSATRRSCCYPEPHRDVAHDDLPGIRRNLHARPATVRRTRFQQRRPGEGGQQLLVRLDRRDPSRRPAEERGSRVPVSSPGSGAAIARGRRSPPSSRCGWREVRSRRRDRPRCARGRGRGPCATESCRAPTCAGSIHGRGSSGPPPGR